MKPFLMLLLLFPLLASARKEHPTEPFMARVIKVYDGDTIYVVPVEQKEDKPYIRVRLYGVDAPELDEPGGIAARNALIKQIDDKPVKLEPKAHDRWARLIAKITLFYGKKES